MSTLQENPTRPAAMPVEFAVKVAQFEPTAAERRYWGEYALNRPRILPVPDLKVGESGYNPSGIWSVINGARHNILYARVEPDQSNPASSHLGKTVSRPYIVAGNRLTPYYDGLEVPGEDPFFTRIRYPRGDGKIISSYLLSTVVATPKLNKPNEVEKIETVIRLGRPEKWHEILRIPGMKDLREVLSNPNDRDNTTVEIFGRPQPQPGTGNINHLRVDNILELTADAVYNAPYIHADLLPIGSGVWGGVGDAERYKDGFLLYDHEAWRTDANGQPDPTGKGRHYQTVLHGFRPDNLERPVVRLGVLATADRFGAFAPKADSGVDLSDTVFPGGACNGSLRRATCGVRDNRVGIFSIAMLG